MPLGPSATATGHLSSSDDTWGTVTGPLDGAEVLSTLLGTVSTAVADSFSAASVIHYYRVKLDGVWVPESDLSGPLVVDDAIDNIGRTFSFGLIGKAYGSFLTRKVWTRAPVEIHSYRGPVGAMTSETPELSGFVIACQEDSGPVIRVSCGDYGTAGAWSERKLCFEVAPFSGRTRGSIVRDIALNELGIGAVSCPDGSRYYKPVQVYNEVGLHWLREFARPEGWRLRWLSDGTLEFWRPELKTAPEPADDTWTRDDWFSLEVDPPRRVPSRWILRANAAVTADELGQTTTTVTSEIVAPYSPKTATHQQDTAGVITPSGLGSNPTADQVVYRSVLTTTKLGNRPLLQDLKEWEWYNPRAAKQQASGVSENYTYLARWIDVDGNFVQSKEERFQLVKRRLTEYHYDPIDDTPTGQTERTYRFNKGVAKGIRNSTVGEPADIDPDYSGWIHTDNRSYSREKEVFGLVEEHVITHTYRDTAPRARDVTTTERWAAEPIPALVVGATGYFVNHDGTGQTEREPTWKKMSEERDVNVLDESGNTLGSTVAGFAYQAFERPRDGLYDWGSFLSDQKEAQWGLVEQRSEAFDVHSEDQYTRVGRDALGERRETTFTGSSPLPVFVSSVWTNLAQQPIEAVIDDATLQSWFGFGREIIESPFVQNQAEAFDLIRRALRRATSHEVTVVMPLGPWSVGDTIKLVEPEHGIAHRAMIVEISQTRVNWSGEATATYVLEVPNVA